MHISGMAEAVKLCTEGDYIKSCPVTLIFLTPTAKFEQDHPPMGATNAGGVVKICHFRRKMCYNSKTVQARRIGSIKVE